MELQKKPNVEIVWDESYLELGEDIIPQITMVSI